MVAAISPYITGVELYEAEDGAPYVALPTGDWSCMMITPEPSMIGRFGVVITDEAGHVTIHANQTEDAAIMAAVRFADSK